MQIKVRHKFLRDGKRRTVYLDFYERGRRRLEYLGLYLTGNRVQDKETLRLAENIAAKRRLEFANDQHGFVMATKQVHPSTDVVRFSADAEAILIEKGVVMEAEGMLLKVFADEEIPMGLTVVWEKRGGN